MSVYLAVHTCGSPSISDVAEFGRRALELGASPDGSLAIRSDGSGAMTCVLPFPDPAVRAESWTLTPLTDDFEAIQIEVEPEGLVEFYCRRCDKSVESFVSGQSMHEVWQSVMRHIDGHKGEGS